MFEKILIYRNQIRTLTKQNTKSLYLLLTTDIVARDLLALDHFKDVHRSSLHDPTYKLARPLHAVFSGVAIPHPEKVQDGTKGVNRRGYGFGGEDSYFYASNK